MPSKSTRVVEMKPVVVRPDHSSTAKRRARRAASMVELKPSAAHSAAPHAIARGAGWLSVAIGVTQIVAGRTLARRLGMPGRAGAVRGCGFRKVANGTALLINSKPEAIAKGMRASAAGNLLDLAVLARGAGAENPHRARVKAAMGGIAAMLAVEIAAAVMLRKR